ncbi:TIGR01620 family protein [Rhodovulum euryhalinum]
MEKARRDNAERRAAERAQPERPPADPRPKPARAPRLFDTEAPARAAPPSPADAPPVPEPDTVLPPEGRAMQTMAMLAARPPSRLARFFWSALAALIGFAVSLAAWDFVTGLLDRNPVLGGIALVLLGLVLAALSLIALREMAAFARLRRLDTLHAESDAALAAHDLTAARAVLDRLFALYARREDTSWGRQRLAERRDDILDADGLLGLAERELLAPLDAAAMREIEAAARTVATVTAIVPLALADVVAATVANLRMIRRIAEIYGGRGGFLGSVRLARAVMTHLVATGAVAVGDDMLGSIAGGGMLSRLSRRFGEGIVNGALTARVGVAAMEVCRPLPFRALKRPSVGALVKRALAGLFSRPDT